MSDRLCPCTPATEVSHANSRARTAANVSDSRSHGDCIHGTENKGAKLWHKEKPNVLDNTNWYECKIFKDYEMCHIVYKYKA